MDKKDIYEYLAKIYLDASSKKKTRTKNPSPLKKIIFIGFIGVVITVVGSILFFNILNRNKLILARSDKNKLADLKSELALVLQSNVVKINFDFDPIQKEAYSIRLNKLDLSRFKVLGFSVRKANYQDNIALKVEFTNVFREKSEIYLAKIPAYKWRDYEIDFAQFKNISDWSQMSKLSFIVEEWNIQEKKGIIYIDNVKFLQ